MVRLFKLRAQTPKRFVGRWIKLQVRRVRDAGDISISSASAVDRWFFKCAKIENPPYPTSPSLVTLTRF